METDTPIYVNNTHIENVESYIYLVQRYSTRHKNQDKEIQRRKTAGWTAFAKHRDICKGNIGTCLKRQIYNSCVLPAMTYGAETWALTTHAKDKLAVAQSKMERSILNITYRDRERNICVREKTTVTYVIEQVRRRKWTWAGHVSRIRDNRWTLHITNWKPYERKRPRGRPVRRCRDELDDYWKGTIWLRIAQDRHMQQLSSSPNTGHYGGTMMMMYIWIIIYVHVTKSLIYQDKHFLTEFPGLLVSNHARTANRHVVFLPGIKSLLLCYQTLQTLHGVKSRDT
ncbi:hypothetical protein NP493_1271g01001 [Ridgeia piscesae]|uniref:Endonuclease-reverse transcriptase n=1 Tax=Ridgeia piscesae TaxID=27915 RepID=A0AAD9NEQ4_RIDPI|nr:hypothetical protein NP493_1271g01001 [Ridgeia piscesae]